MCRCLSCHVFIEGIVYVTPLYLDPLPQAVSSVGVELVDGDCAEVVFAGCTLPLGWDLNTLCKKTAPVSTVPTNLKLPPCEPYQRGSPVTSRFSHSNSGSVYIPGSRAVDAVEQLRQAMGGSLNSHTPVLLCNSKPT